VLVDNCFVVVCLTGVVVSGNVVVVCGTYVVVSGNIVVVCETYVVVVGGGSIFSILKLSKPNETGVTSSLYSLTKSIVTFINYNYYY
jgi:hypothetical protein